MNITATYYWDFFSKKLQHKIQKPSFVGIFTKESGVSKNMRLVIGIEGSPKTGNAIAIYLLVDEEDGVIGDAKFQAYGSPALIGAADAALELMIHKNYDQASRMSADLIDQHLRDSKTEPSFPEECNIHLNMVISAIDDAVMKCFDIPFASKYESTPISYDQDGDLTQVMENFESFSMEEKMTIIETVIDKEVRPYIELDAGGIRLLELKDNWEVIIAYEGACTSCYASTGSTLSAIQNILQSRLHPNLVVTPSL